MSESRAFHNLFSGGGPLIVPPDGSLPGVLAANAARPATAFPRTPVEFEAARAGLDAMLTQLHAEAVVPEGVDIRETELDGVPALLFEPHTVRGAVLHIHGGGWYMGNPAMMKPMLARWSAELGLTIASLDYRLAPEHRCPTPQDDCERGGLAWIEAVGKRHGKIPTVIAGESAGAHLAAITAIRLRRRHRVRLDGALFTYGLYDFANALPSRRVADAHAGLMDSRYCEFFAQTYLADAAQAFNPEVSPLRAGLPDLADLPPALFIGAMLDPFADDSVLMHSRWTRAGNRAWLALYEDAPHGFDLYGAAHSRHLDTLRGNFLQACINGSL